MATIAIGDIHGNLPALEDLLNRLHPELRHGDLVVFLGDYIDRGPDSCGCIEAILRFRDDIPAEMVCLCGNHEDWMLRTRSNYRRHSWLLAMDALVTVRSYSIDAEQAIRSAKLAAGAELYTGDVELPYGAFFDILPATHRAFFDSLAFCCKTADCICSHGGLDTRIAALAEQDPQSLIWGAGTFPEGYEGSTPVVYGHWNNAELDTEGWPQPTVIGNTTGIDTISHGVLTAIRMPERHIVQSARHGHPGVDPRAGRTTSWQETKKP
jgi:serine/threonine protein phosphatase 1